MVPYLLKKLTRAGHRPRTEGTLPPKLLKGQNAALLVEREGLTPPCATRGPESSSTRGSPVAGVDLQTPSSTHSPHGTKPVFRRTA